MHLTNAIRNAQFSVNRITVARITAAQFTVAHFTVADFTDPTKNGCRIYRYRVFRLPSFPLPTLPLPSLPFTGHRGTCLRPLHIFALLYLLECKCRRVFTRSLANRKCSRKFKLCLQLSMIKLAFK